MDQLQHEFRQRLIKGIGVLSKLIRSVDAGSQQGYEVTRKLAASVRRGAEAYGYPQLIAAAAPFENAPPEALRMLARRLLHVMEAVAINGWDDQQRILLIDPDLELAEQLAARLDAPTRKLVHAKTAREAWEAIDTQDVALIILDLVLPDADGRNLVSALRGDPRTSVLPLVILSDWGSQEVRAECFALGADQFFEKSGDLDLLAIAVASTLHRSTNQARDTHHDVVSQLLSREGAREKFKRQSEKAAQKQKPLSVVVLDLDLSRSRAGAPEEFLYFFVQVIREVLRPTDSVARWDESELILLLTNTDKQGAARAVERIQEATEDQPFVMGNVKIHLEFSHGAAQVTPGMSLDQAVAEADRALFAARLVTRAGRFEAGSSRAKIIVADQDAENVFAVRRAFESNDFDVLHLTSARQALKEASVGRVRLIIVDRKLPDMPGIELVERLRRMPRLVQTPIIMTSATGRDNDTAHAFERGVDDYVFKPVTSNALVARMRRLMKRAQPPSSGPFKVMRQAGAMAGLFAGEQLFELVQMVGLNRKTGRLVLSSDSYSGHVDFLQGVITKAWTSRGLEGRPACEQLLDLSSGRFEFWPGDDAISQSGELLHLNVDNLLLDAMRRRDESGLGLL